MRQTCLPAFEGLFPSPHDQIVQKLIHTVASVHCYAKMRIHHDATLTSLDESISTLGEILRDFMSITCKAHESKELPAEVERRVRLEARRQARSNANGEKRPNTGSLSYKRARIEKAFNINTPKFHSIGHLKHSILTYGTTDSYSTHIVGSLQLHVYDPLLNTIVGRNSA